MKKLKQTLALALVVCMLCSCLPVGALASGNTTDNAAALESNEAVIQATSELTPAEPNRPEDGSTQNQPFPSGTAGSTYFRIPAITTLSNGNLLAAADARWNDIYDKGNIDTLVSVSEDNGANWNYSFANYIDDGGNTFNISAATFIDPAVAVKTVNGVETIYMVADLFPGQASGSTMCIHAALYGTGMTDGGHLRVSDLNDNNLNDFNYYVGDYTDGVAPLCNSNGTATDYVVDEWFNVYKNGTHLGNLFTYGDVTDGDKTFYVYQTSYLVLTKSTDGGKTWSAPTMLNHQVKSSSEKFYGVGPASGIVTSDGTIMFTAYTFTSSDGKTSTFYSKDNGVTWERGADLSSQSSEAALAEGNDGVVYLFNRYGQVCYTSDYGESWTYLNSGVGYATGCEVSALTYSKTIDGKKAILVCGPTSGRYGGKIFVGLINADNSITWKYNYAVNNTSEPFQYSSMTELADGSIGLLYENTVNTTAGVVYKNLPIKTIIGEDAVIGTPEKPLSLTVGETHSFKLDEVVNSGSHTSDAADVTWTKSSTTVSVPAAQLGNNTSYSGDMIDLNDCLYTFTKSGNVWQAESNGIYLYPGNTANAGYPNRATAYSNLSIEAGYEENTFYIKSNDCDKNNGNTSYLYFDRSNPKWDRVDSPGSNTTWKTNCSLMLFKPTETAEQADGAAIPGFEQVTGVAAADLESGEYLVVAPSSDGSTLYALHPSTSTSDKWSHVAKITGGFTNVSTYETTVEIEAKAEGTTNVVIGSTEYIITVKPESTGEDEGVVKVELKIDETKTYTDNSGNYENAEGNVDPDSSIATMTVTGTPAVKELREITSLDQFVSGKSYFITSRNGKHVLKDEAYDNTSLKIGDVVSLDSTELWTFTATDTSEYFTIARNGKYLNIADGSITMGTNSQNLRVYRATYNGETHWIIADGKGNALNNNAQNNVKAGEYSPDAGGLWRIYEIVETTPASTEITFTGVAEGNTTAIVGNTKYIITVTSEATVNKTVEVPLMVGQSKTYTDETGNYENNIPLLPDTSIATAVVTGSSTSEMRLSDKVTAIESGKTYVLYNKSANKLMNNQWADARVGGGGTNGLALSSSKNGFQDNDCWTITVTDGGYYVRDINGKYLTIARGSAGVSDSPVVASLAYDGTDWTIGVNGEYANNYGQAGSAVAGWNDINDTCSQWEIYEVVSTVTSASTSITFKGVAPGTTTAVVGNTLYNITVMSADDCVTSENSPFVVGSDFIGSVTDDPKNKGMDYLTRLTMSSVMTKQNLGGGSRVGYQIDLSSAFDDAQNISWSIADENIAKIEVSADGKTVYVTAADANTTGTTYLSCTIDGETYTIPVVIMKTTEATSGWKYNSLHIAEITRTDVWYSWNNSGDADQFVKAIEGEAIWTVYARSREYFSISFYGAPDPDHALTYMSATNSAGEYHTLADKNDPTKCDYYTKAGSGYNQRTGPHFTDEQVANDIRAALSLGCDGAQGFYRSATDPNPVNCNLMFISDPVPVIDKTVDGVLPITRKQANYRRYAENMVASVNEQVYFKITVTLGAPSQWMPYDRTKHAGSVVIDGVTYGTDANGNRYSAITYSDAIVTDYALGTEHAFIYTKDIDKEDGVWDGNIPEANRRQEENVTDELNKAWTEEELEAGKREIPLYLVYTIQEEDIPKSEITNTADLNFKFQSHYSTGAAAREADADAKISMVGTTIDSVVIDFGQKITYSDNSFVSISDGQLYTFSGLTNAHLKGAYVDGETIGNVTGSKAIAKYGTATVTRTQRLDENGEPVLDGKKEPDYLYTVTYTPTSILQSADTIQIYGIGADNKEKLINSILVYPATTVYYEEGFLENVNNGWSFEDDAEKATTNQSFELLGFSRYDDDGKQTHFVSGKRYAYGFDPIYDGITENGEVAPSSISATDPGAIAKFTFTGTGFELFANCTNSSSYVNVSVNNADGDLVKMYTVNTVVKGGTGENNGATVDQTGAMNALPIVSLKDLEHGTYTVTVTKVMNDGNAVTIDGVRITNTISESSIYNIDLEDNPEFYQMRDSVMNALDLDAESSADYGDLTGKAQQVYNDLLGESKDENGNTVTDTETPVAVITDVNGIYGDGASLQDLLDNGPKNELYLWPNQTLTFKVRTNRTMQVGLKAPSGMTVFSGTAVGSNPDDDMNTPIYNAVYGTTDMFYDLVTRPVTETDNVYTVTITNMGENVLAITDLKVCDDPNASFVPLTLEDVTDILRDAGYTDSSAPEAPLPFEDVPADAFYYEPVAWAVKNGITNGISDTRFAPDNLTTRGQIVTFLWRAAGEPEPASTTNPFADVDESEFYYKAILWAVETGITNGVTKTTFNPDGNCTRAQAVTFLYRYAGKPTVEGLENPFEDISSKEFYYNAILWAVKNGITTGVTPTTFVPDATCTRGQIVSFLYRHMAD